MIDRYKMACLVVAAVAVLAISFSAEADMHGKLTPFKATPSQCYAIKKISSQWLDISLLAVKDSDQLFVWSRENTMENLSKAASFATIYIAFYKKHFPDPVRRK